MYDAYKHARNTAWRVLVDCGIDRLPVDLNILLDYFNLDLITYSNCALTQMFSDDAISGDGFVTQLGSRRALFLNDTIKTRGRRRFTVAHEIGHIALRHNLDEICARNSELDSEQSPDETAANIFARDILAPACVLAALNIHTPDQIMSVCDISRRSAEIRAERLALLYARNKFGSHPLERTVLRQFTPFIDEYNKAD